jgi:hemolysin activation/secretion protein
MEPHSITRMSELKALAQKIEQYVIDHGYPVFHVAVPDQEIFNGRVRMLVYNGKIDKVIHVLKTDHRIDDEKIQAYFTDLIKTGGFKRLDFERTMLLINDLPGIKARLILNPGKEPGLIDADLEITEGKLANFTLSADNTGGTLTGRNRLTGIAKLNDITGAGDRLTVIGNITNQNLHAGIIEYKRPIGISGLVASGSITLSDYQISDKLVSLGIKGNSQTYEAGISYPILLNFGRNIYADVSIADKHFSTTMVDEQRKEIVAEKIGLRGSVQDSFIKGASNFASIYYFNGEVMPGQGYTDATHTTYQKISYSLTRVQSLPQGFSLKLSLNGQVSHGALDGSEGMSLGGATAVRAYNPSAFYANDGYVFTTELNKDIANLGAPGVLKSSVFYDQGTSLYETVYGGTNNLQGAGFSLALQKWGWYELKTTYAHRIGKSTPGNLIDDVNGSGRIWVNLLTFF